MLDAAQITEAPSIFIYWLTLTPPKRESFLLIQKYNKMQLKPPGMGNNNDLSVD